MEERERTAVCTWCGLLCDDIVVRVVSSRVTHADTHGCQAGGDHFLEAEPRADPLIRGRSAALEDALDHAADLLATARHPLVLGLTDIGSEAQRLAVSLADVLGAAIDLAPVADPRAHMRALEAVGEVTATLGEVRNRADLIVCWGVDPVESHPRFLSRVTERVADDERAGPALVVVDTALTATATRADWFLKIAPDQAFEVLTMLRTHMKLRSGPGAKEPHDDVERLARMLRDARFAAIFYDPARAGLTAHPYTLVQLSALVQDIRHHTRCASIPLGAPVGHGNATGASAVLAWQTGYASAVDLGRGYPRGGDEEFSADSLLCGGEVDVVAQIGRASDGGLGPPARQQLARLSRIVISPIPDAGAVVSLPIATTGIGTPGTVYRLDGVPLHAPSVIDASLPSASDILRQVLSRVRARRQSETGQPPS
jgi:formylmethanofuran dehydrogenase subunit B